MSTKAKQAKFPKITDVGEIGRVKFKGKTWIIATAPLRKHRLRGAAMTPKKANLPGVILVSTHLKPGGDLCRVALIHEALRVALPSARERDVEAAAFLVDRVLLTAFRALTVSPPSLAASREGQVGR